MLCFQNFKAIYEDILVLTIEECLCMIKFFTSKSLLYLNAPLYDNCQVPNQWRNIRLDHREICLESLSLKQIPLTVLCSKHICQNFKAIDRPTTLLCVSWFSLIWKDGKRKRKLTSKRWFTQRKTFKSPSLVLLCDYDFHKKNICKASRLPTFWPFSG